MNYDEQWETYHRHEAITNKLGRRFSFFMVGAFLSIAIAVVGLFVDALTLPSIVISLACILGTIITSLLSKYHFKKMNTILESIVEDISRK